VPGDIDEVELETGEFKGRGGRGRGGGVLGRKMGEPSK
jgi:hypothetical protein